MPRPEAAAAAVHDEPDGAVPALEVPRALDARARRRDRRHRHRAGDRLHGRARVPEAGQKDHDLGPISDYPEGKYVIATYTADEAQGDVSRRTAFVRYNGQLNGQPSFTIISNHCAHLGCPVQANGPLDEKNTKQLRRRDADPDGLDRRLRLSVPRRPVQHRGQPHRRPAGARARPLRVLDPERPPVHRQAVLGLARRRRRRHGASIHKWTFSFPGEHVNGIESWLYPIQPPH